MNYKNLIWIMTIFILSISSVSAYCLQQQTNESTIGDGNCTLNYTGVSRLADPIQINLTGFSYYRYDGYIYINYTKPEYLSPSGNLWEVKHGLNTTSGTPLLYNQTIPTQCITNSSTLQLRFRSYGLYYSYVGRTDGNSWGECYNSTSNWEIITLQSTDTAQSSTFDGSAIASSGYGGVDKDYSTNSAWLDCTIDSSNTCKSNPIYFSFKGAGNGGFRYAVLYEESINWNILSCIEDWTPVYNESCNGIIENNFLTYEDNNMCNTTYNLPVNNGTIQSCCVENWIQNNTICDGYNETIQYYDNSSCGTTFQLPILNGTIFDCHCYPNWVTESNICVNNVNLLTYADSNMCGSNESLPSNNGTYTSCVTQTQNTFALTPDQLTIAILIFMIIVAMVCAITVHEGFFGMVALLFALMMTTFIYYDYPVVTIFASGFMILLFVVMWIIIGRAKR